MKADSKVYVAGHRGLVGSAIIRRLQAGGYRNIVTRTHAELDLVDQAAVQAFFASERPEYVFLAAAKVGGISANNTYPAEFIYQNLMIEANTVHAAYRNGVSKLMLLGSSCIYPKHAPQPMTEGQLLTGPLEPTNEPYALAKIAGIKLCAAYNRQYGTNYLCVMPTNLYGPGDNYDLDASHVIPALIRKTHEAKQHGDAEVVIWGTGKPRREFLHSDDLAEACVFLIERHNAKDIGEFINIGSGKDCSIMELAELIADIVGFKGTIRTDAGKPDGAPRKLLDVRRMSGLGWQARISLREGIQAVYNAYR